MSSVTGHLSDVQTAQNNIVSAENSLNTLVTGPDPLDVSSAQLSVLQQQDNYNNSFVRAPFDGVIAQLNVQNGDAVTSGTSIGTFITQQKVATISLNEVDAAKVQVGQKVMITFDAINGLSISGEVVGVDLVGTVSQGVVSYNVQIGFDTQDPRVRSGMSISAAVITDVEQNVLVVPNTAIKSQGTASYVQKFATKVPATSVGGQGITSTTPPVSQQVQIGVSNDSSTEITSGLSEGDQIVVRTIAPTTTTTTTQAPSLLGGGAGGGGGGAARGLLR